MCSSLSRKQLITTFIITLWPCAEPAISRSCYGTVEQFFLFLCVMVHSICIRFHQPLWFLVAPLWKIAVEFSTQWSHKLLPSGRGYIYHILFFFFSFFFIFFLIIQLHDVRNDQCLNCLIGGGSFPSRSAGSKAS